MAQADDDQDESYSGTEQPFALDLALHIQGLGHMEIEAPKMIARVCREMHLLFGDRVEVEQLGEVRAIQLQQHKVELEEVPEMDSQEVMPGLPLWPFVAW